MLFDDRHEAGRKLAGRLEHLRAESPVVIGLARGGVPVAYEVAAALGVPLDVALVRKVQAPGEPEYSIGVVAEDGVRVVHTADVAALGIAPGEVERAVVAEESELERLARLYRGEQAPIPLEGRTAVLVDDGVATGMTALAAVRALRGRGAARVVLAVPVSSPGTIRLLGPRVDELVCLHTPEPFFGIAHWYSDYTQTSDGDVGELLAAAREGRPPREAGSRTGGRIAGPGG